VYSSELYMDGIYKVNIWTTLERDSSLVPFKHMVKNAAKVTRRKVVERLKKEGFLGECCSSTGTVGLVYFTTLYRQDIGNSGDRLMLCLCNLATQTQHKSAPFYPWLSIYSITKDCIC